MFTFVRQKREKKKRRKEKRKKKRRKLSSVGFLLFDRKGWYLRRKGWMRGRKIKLSPIITRFW